MTHRIFILEDDPRIVALVRFAFKSAGEAWELAAHERVEGVLAALEAFGPDLILLDVNLPDGNGLEVCRLIRRRRALKRIPVIFLTAQTDVESRVRGFELGAQDYVPKPFAPGELVARIRVHLRIRRRVERLNQKRHAEAARERLRQDLTDMIVHDLKAPIGSIRATLETLQDGGLLASSADCDQLVRGSQAATEFMLLMLNDLLDLGAGKLEVRPAPLDLQALNQRLWALFSASMARRRLSFAANLPGGLPPIETDPAILFRVLANIVQNAVKMSRPGGSVELEAKPARGQDGAARLRLEVADEGPGVPEAERERIFEKYYRVRSGPAVLAPGTGIGLAFCKLAVSALQGRVWVEPRAGCGSRFCVELPSLAREADGA